MQLDLAKIDAQMKRLEELRRIASDKELLALLETVVVKNGHQVASETPMAKSPAPPRWKEGTVIASIAQAASIMEGPFSGYQLAEKMKSQGFHFNSSKAGVYVSDVLRNTLEKRGAVRIFKKGHGSDPTFYEWVL